MIGEKVDFKTAQTMTSSNKGRIYTGVGKGNSGFERSQKPFPDIFHAPKFQIDASSKFFTIGSCFAREIEIALQGLGVDCITSKFSFPGDLYELQKNQATNGALNAYTPHSILDLVRLPERSDASTAGRVQLGPDEYCDMLLSGLKFLTLQQAEMVRKTLIDAYRELPQADVVIITLGYTEAWYDTESKIFVNRSPGSAIRLLRNHGERFQFLNASPLDAVETVDAAISEIRRLTDGRAKVVLTTSPVPLHGTFTARDSILANQYSKSTLLSAAVYLSSKYEYVDYFPSYEMVANINKGDALMDDGVHVRRNIVDQIIDKFAKLYFRPKDI